MAKLSAKKRASAEAVAVRPAGEGAHKAGASTVRELPHARQRPCHQRGSAGEKNHKDGNLSTKDYERIARKASKILKAE